MFNKAANKSKLFAQQARNYSTLQRPVIVSAVRTPIGSFNGRLSGFEAPKLGALAVRGAVEQAGITKADVQEVIMGNVVSSNLGQAPARQAAIHAGLNQSTICTTVNKMCASGMKAIMFASQSIMLGQANCIVAGGMESMTNAPYLLPKVRQGLRYGDSEIIDSLKRDGLTDAYDGSPMGNCSDKTAKDYSLTREEVDKYAIESYNRAAAATTKGHFKNELLTVAIPDKAKGTVYFNEDEEYKNIKLDKIPTLKPAFDKSGVSTAANSSKLSDGAAAVVVMSEEKAQRAGLKPIARILGFADAEKAPIEFTTAPSDAIPKAIKAAGLKQSDIEYYEINEAFAVVALANMKILGLDPTRVNVFGGAVALGHPIGASGARIVATLINVLKVHNARYGVAAICNGGGGASAICIERLE